MVKHVIEGAVAKAGNPKGKWDRRKAAAGFQKKEGLPRDTQLPSHFFLGPAALCSLAAEYFGKTEGVHHQHLM
jgi:hypothetical protein